MSDNYVEDVLPLSEAFHLAHGLVVRYKGELVHLSHKIDVGKPLTLKIRAKVRNTPPPYHVLGFICTNCKVEIDGKTGKKGNIDATDLRKWLPILLTPTGSDARITFWNSVALRKFETPSSGLGNFGMKVEEKSSDPIYCFLHCSAGISLKPDFRQFVIEICEEE